MIIPCAHKRRVRASRPAAARAGLKGQPTFCGLRTVSRQMASYPESLATAQQEQALRSTRVRRWRARDESLSPADAPPNWCSRAERGRALQFFEREVDGVRARTTRARVFPGVVRLRFGGASESARAVASFPGTRLHPGIHRGRRARHTMRWPSECTEIKPRLISSTTRSDCPSTARCWRYVTLATKARSPRRHDPRFPRRRTRTAPQSARIEASHR